MPRLPVLDGRSLVRLLERHDFIRVRSKGSHVRLRHCDGRVKTVPVHAGRDPPVGTLRSILRDLDTEPAQLIDWLKGQDQRT